MNKARSLPPGAPDTQIAREEDFPVGIAARCFDIYSVWQKLTGKEADYCLVVHMRLGIAFEIGRNGGGGI